MSVDIAYEDVAKAFSYDPRTGIITRNLPTRQNPVGSICTFHCDSRQYLAVSMKLSNGKWKQLSAHRVAFMLMNKYWPADVLDHVDGDGTNNIWSNIREASISQNMANSALRRDSSTGYKGVVVHKGRYVARITHNNKQIHIGTFDYPDEAHQAYMNYAKSIYNDFAFSG